MDALKIVLVGDAGVGKTSITYWLLKNKQYTDNCETIGAAFSTKEISMPINKAGIDYETKIKFNIWDTAGQEKYRSIAKIYYKNTVGCLCVFDLTNRDSFLHMDRWLNDYRENSMSYESVETNFDNIIIIVANKSDYPESKWAVTRNDIKNFAAKHKCLFTFTNCITGEGVHEAFSIMAKTIIDKTGLPAYAKPYTIAIEKESNGIITNLTNRVPLIPKRGCAC